MGKSFLVLFFKKELLPALSFPWRRSRRITLALCSTAQFFRCAAQPEAKLR
jgi:hypothetical protein